MTICHVTPSGQKQTLTLPKKAALAHLATHPLDFPGTCPIEENGKDDDKKESELDPVTPEVPVPVPNGNIPVPKI